MNRMDAIDAIRKGSYLRVDAEKSVQLFREGFFDSQETNILMSLKFPIFLSLILILISVVFVGGWALPLLTLIATASSIGFQRRHAAKSLFNKAVKNDELFDQMWRSGILELSDGRWRVDLSHYAFGKNSLPIFGLGSRLRVMTKRREDGTWARYYFPAEEGPSKIDDPSGEAVGARSDEQEVHILGVIATIAKTLASGVSNPEECDHLATRVGAMDDEEISRRWLRMNLEERCALGRGLELMQNGPAAHTELSKDEKFMRAYWIASGEDRTGC